MAGWDAASESYQAEGYISVDDVHYGPLCPGERELGIIGDVIGKRVLEPACGGAQNSIALAKWGAHVTAMDISPRQLAHARALIDKEDVVVRLVRGDMEDLSMFRGAAFDLVVSSFGWEFIPDLEACFRECARVLRGRGLLIVCTVHPLSAFEWDEQEQGLIVTDYFHPPVEVWDDHPGYDGRRGLTFFHGVEEMFSLLTSVGFSVERIVEPYPYDIAQLGGDWRSHVPYAGKFWEGQYERLRRVPFSIVYRARKA